MLTAAAANPKIDRDCASCIGVAGEVIASAAIQRVIPFAASKRVITDVAPST